jgi:hypothetical protein
MAVGLRGVNVTWRLSPIPARECGASCTCMSAYRPTGSTAYEQKYARYAPFRYAAVQNLAAKEWTISANARKLRLDRHTVRKFC